MKKDIWALVRKSIIGRDAFIDTPFGQRLVTYADYTASGRGIEFIEGYIEQILKHYANTHTEDDSTGMITTERLHKAEGTIKRLRYAIWATIAVALLTYWTALGMNPPAHKSVKGHTAILTLINTGI